MATVRVEALWFTALLMPTGRSHAPSNSPWPSRPRGASIQRRCAFSAQDLWCRTPRATRGPLHFVAPFFAAPNHVPSIFSKHPAKDSQCMLVAGVANCMAFQILHGPSFFILGSPKPSRAGRPELQSWRSRRAMASNSDQEPAPEVTVSVPLRSIP